MGGVATGGGDLRYAAFLSHFKVETAMEARFLQSELHAAIGQRIFLDSDDLSDLRLLRAAVLNSDTLVLVQSKGVLERPWCILEAITAIEHNIPIVGVNLSSGAHPYDFSESAAFLRALDTQLAVRNPTAPALLAENGVDDLGEAVDDC